MMACGFMMNVSLYPGGVVEKEIMNSFNKIRISFWMIMCFALPINAETDVNDFDEIARTVFWENLYKFGGWTLQCGYRFESDQKTVNGRNVRIDHIYPTSWMMEQADCQSRMQCRESQNNDFAVMEADMHNLYPVWQPLVTYRYGQSFGELEGEDWRFDDCDVEWSSGVMEPRDVARGNIARSIFYMNTQYGVTIRPELLQLLRKWNKQDPPSEQEKARNDSIEGIQGRRNPFIDEPSLVDQIYVID
jgi:deoxyribonuclease-1